MYAKLSIYSEYFLGSRTERVRVDLVGGDAGGGAASARLAAPTTRRRFVRILSALCEAFRCVFLAKQLVLDLWRLYSLQELSGLSFGLILD
jgi:hypothetical protein